MDDLHNNIYSYIDIHIYIYTYILIIHQTCNPSKLHLDLYIYSYIYICDSAEHTSRLPAPNPCEMCRKRREKPEHKITKFNGVVWTDLTVLKSESCATWFFCITYQKLSLTKIRPSLSIITITDTYSYLLLSFQKSISVSFHGPGCWPQRRKPRWRRWCQRQRRWQRHL